MNADQIIEEINNILEGDTKTAAKISRILMLISGDEDIYNRILLALENIVYANIDIKQVKNIFKSTEDPDDKVASFFYLLTGGNPNKYNEISDILMS